MKCILYSLPILFLILFACKKDNNNNKHTPTSTEALQGMWILYKYWNGPSAGLVVWKPATESKRIFFNADLSFRCYTASQDNYVFTPGKDTSLLKLYKEGTTDTTSYFVKVTPDTLILNSLECIEGCGEKYIRQPLGAL